MAREENRTFFRHSFLLVSIYDLAYVSRLLCSKLLMQCLVVCDLQQITLTFCTDDEPLLEEML